MKKLEIKILTERIKEELEEFEIKRLEIETEIKAKILKQTHKTVKKKFGKWIKRTGSKRNNRNNNRKRIEKTWNRLLLF